MTETPKTGAESPADEQTVPGQGNDPAGPQWNAPKVDRGLLEARDRYLGERDEARQERDSALARIEQLQTAELHRLAAELLAVPEDIELSGKTLAEYLTPEGWVDRKAVAEAAAAVIESRPGLAKNPKVAATDPTQGIGGGGGDPKADWVTFLRSD